MLTQFFVMYFVAHDIMGRTCAEDPSAMTAVDHSWLQNDDLNVVCSSTGFYVNDAFLTELLD